MTYLTSFMHRPTEYTHAIHTTQQEAGTEMHAGFSEGLTSDKGPGQSTGDITE